MERHLQLPGQSLRSISTMFTARLPPGRIAIDVRVLRRSRSVSHVMVSAQTEAAENGEAGLHCFGVFGAPGPGFALTDTQMPDVPEPALCPSFRDIPKGTKGFLGAPLWDRIEVRRAKGHGPWEEYQPATSEQAYWFRFEEPPLRSDGSMDRLAFIVLCDTMIGPIAERMGSGLPKWLAPSMDLTVRLFGDSRAPWLLTRCRALHAEQGFAYLEAELWDPERRALIAVANQLARFRFLDNDVTGEIHAPTV